MNIDLGCGNNKLDADWFGIDCQPFPCVDLVCDCNGVIPLDDNIADKVAAIDFLEHVQNDKRIHIMTEIWRLLKHGGIAIIRVPSTDGRGAFQDPTHLSFWNQNSFQYYTLDNYRELYGIQAQFNVCHIETTPIDSEGICWVEAVLEAVKHPV